MPIDNSFVAIPLACALIATTVFVGRHWGAAKMMPVLVHNVLWAAALALVGSGLIRYTVAPLGSWGILITGLACFNLGFVAVAARRQAEVASERAWPSWLPRHRQVGPVALAIIAIGYAAGMGIYLIIVGARFGPLTLFTNPSAIRNSDYLVGVPFYVKALIYLGPLLFTLLARPYSTTVQMGRVVRVVALAVVGGSMLLMLQRINLFLALLWAGTLVLAEWGSTQHRNLPGRRMALIVVGAIVAAGAAFQVLAFAMGKTASELVETGVASPILDATGTLSLVVYFTGGIAAFLQLVGSVNGAWPPVRVLPNLVIGDYNPQTFGATLLRPVAQLIPGFRPFPDPAPFIQVPFPINVFTWLEPFYRDFRWAGVAIGLLAVGALLALLWGVRTRSYLLLWLSAWALTLVALSTMTWRGGDNLWLLSAVYALITFGAPIRRPKVQLASRSDEPEHDG